MNYVRISGKLKESPDLNDTRGGEPLANLKVLLEASSDGTKYHLIQVRAYGEISNMFYENEYEAGDELFIRGYLKEETWHNRKTGDEFSRIVVVAKEIKDYDYSKVSSANFEW